MNIGNELKSIINMVVPGRPFPEVILTAQSFMVVFNVVPKYLYTEQGLYTTGVWYLPGLVYAHFGYFFALPAGMALGFGWTRIYRISCFLQWKYREFLKILLLKMTLIMGMAMGSLRCWSKPNHEDECDFRGPWRLGDAIKEYLKSRGVVIEHSPDETVDDLIAMLDAFAKEWSDDTVDR